VTLPERAARMYLELGEWDLRSLAGITNSPLLRADGSIVLASGYDAESQLFCDGPPAVDVKERPSEGDVAAALMTLRHAFRTFPFADADMIPGGPEGVDVVDIEHPAGCAEAS